MKNQAQKDSESTFLIEWRKYMAKRITDSTPKQDGFRMPGEFEKQERIFMLWPERTDNWRDGAKPVQGAYAAVAEAIAEFESITMFVSDRQYENCRATLSDKITVLEMSSNDAWIRDCGPTFLVNAKGERRACYWKFNAWGGLYDGLYFPWDKDDRVAEKVCELLKNSEIRASVDSRNESLGKRIREISLLRVPIIAIVGEKEVSENSVSVRREGVDAGSMSLDQFVQYINSAVAEELKN